MSNEGQKENMEQEARTDETMSDTYEESDDERGHFPPDVKEYVITTKQVKVEIPKEKGRWSDIYKCPEASCEFSSRSWNHVRDHYKTHSGEKPYQCKFCDKKFSQKPNCETHIRTHDDKFKFKCEVDECDAKFTEYRNLKKHGAAKHDIDMPKTVGLYYYYQMNPSSRYFCDEEW